MTETTSYKRLDFVAKSVATASGLAETAYKTARSYTPTFVEPYVAKVEDTASTVGAPYMTFVADTGAKVLQNADELVDYTVGNSYKAVENGKTTVMSTLTNTKTFHDTNLKSFGDAREKYFKYVEETADLVKAKLNPKPYIDLTYTALKDSLARAQELADPDVAVDAVHQAWTKFAALAPVSKVLETADPMVGFAQSKYTQLHGTVVANPYYKKAFDLAGSTVAKAQDTLLYKRSKDLVYPYISSLADPALAKISGSKYVAALVAHVKPAL